MIAWWWLLPTALAGMIVGGTLMAVMASRRMDELNDELNGSQP